jgi:monoamine oxidase
MSADRRDFLRLGTFGAALVATGNLIASDDKSADTLPDRHVDVAIVGAGLAGLTTARALEKSGATVCILEARDRVGGRTLDHPIGGGHVVEGVANGWALARRACWRSQRGLAFRRSRATKLVSL